MATDDEDDSPIMLSPSLIRALETRGFKRGEGKVPTKEDLIAALGDVMGVPVVILANDDDAEFEDSVNRDIDRN